jgi:quercetin dioxygenase-like cupin family protein
MTTFALSPAIESLPWLPVSPGFDLKLVRGGTDDDTRALILRLQPGTVVARHRHTGEIHALHLAGQRKLLDTGEIIGPGGYVYEPTGNIDSWMAVGDEPLVIFLTARGAIEYLDDRGQVARRSTTAQLTATYRELAARA